jgi:chromosome segregation ATPase
MSRAGLTFSVFLGVLFLGLVGCGRTQTPTSASAADRVKTLEARVARVEEDYRSAAATRDQARQQASQLQEQKTQLEEQLAKLTAELEAQKTALAQEQNMVRQRTTERDTLQSRCEKLKKGLQTLLGQDDAAATPATSAGAL